MSNYSRNHAPSILQKPAKSPSSSVGSSIVIVPDGVASASTDTLITILTNPVNDSSDVNLLSVKDAVEDTIISITTGSQLTIDKGGTSSPPLYKFTGTMGVSSTGQYQLDIDGVMDG